MDDELFDRFQRVLASSATTKDTTLDSDLEERLARLTQSKPKDVQILPEKGWSSPDSADPIVLGQLDNDPDLLKDISVTYHASHIEPPNTKLPAAPSPTKQYINFTDLVLASPTGSSSMRGEADVLLDQVGLELQLEKKHGSKTLKNKASLEHRVEKLRKFSGSSVVDVKDARMELGGPPDPVSLADLQEDSSVESDQETG